MSRALEHGRVLTTSMHLPEVVESEARTSEGLLCGHEYSVSSVVEVDGEQLVLLQVCIRHAAGDVVHTVLNVAEPPWEPGLRQTPM